MSVRLTPSESEGTAPQESSVPPAVRTNEADCGEVPAADVPTVHDDDVPGGSDTVDPRPGADPGADPAADPGDSDPAASGDGRRALREARKQRRRTAWVCAVVVALCLALTIVVVSLARYRPATPPGSVVPALPAALLSIESPADAVSSQTIPSQTIPSQSVPSANVQPALHPSRSVHALEGDIR